MSRGLYKKMRLVILLIKIYVKYFKSLAWCYILKNYYCYVIFACITCFSICLICVIFVIGNCCDILL